MHMYKITHLTQSSQIPFCVFLISLLLCCSPLDTVTHSFNV